MTFKGFLRLTYKRLHRDIKGFDLKITPRNAVDREVSRIRIPNSPPKSPVNKQVCLLWAFSFHRFFGEYILRSLLIITRFHAKNAFIRTLPYVLAYLLNMIRLFLKRLLPMPRLDLLPLHPWRTVWNRFFVAAHWHPYDFSEWLCNRAYNKIDFALADLSRLGDNIFWQKSFAFSLHNFQPPCICKMFLNDCLGTWNFTKIMI